MKKLTLFLTMILSFLSLTVMADVNVTGPDAQKLFTGLLGKYEYKSGANATGLSIDTTIRHDNGTITCSKDIVTYNTGSAEISYECNLKS